VTPSHGLHRSGFPNRLSLLHGVQRPSHESLTAFAFGSLILTRYPQVQQAVYFMI